MIRLESLGSSGTERLGWLALFPPVALLGCQLGWWLVYRGQLEALNGFFAGSPAAAILVVVAGMMCPTVTSACGGLMIARRQRHGWLLFLGGVLLTCTLVAARPA